MNTSRQTARLQRMAAGLALVFPLSSVALADENETLQRAADLALQQLAQELDQKAFEGVKNVAVVPLRSDVGEYATNRVRDAVTQTKFALFARSDDTWNELLAEIEWGVRREDVMNPETVQKFGRIEGVDAILYGRIWDQAVNLWSIRGHVKLSVILADVETGQELWRSGPLEGEAFIHWSDAIMQFWRYPLLLLVVLALLVVLGAALAKIKRAYKPL